jgi:hypothetical protein
MIKTKDKDIKSIKSLSDSKVSKNKSGIIFSRKKDASASASANASELPKKFNIGEWQKKKALERKMKALERKIFDSSSLAKEFIINKKAAEKVKMSESESASESVRKVIGIKKLKKREEEFDRATKIREGEEKENKIEKLSKERIEVFVNEISKENEEKEIVRGVIKVLKTLEKGEKEQRIKIRITLGKQRWEKITLKDLYEKWYLDDYLLVPIQIKESIKEISKIMENVNERYREYVKNKTDEEKVLVVSREKGVDPIIIRREINPEEESYMKSRIKMTIEERVLIVEAYTKGYISYNSVHTPLKILLMIIKVTEEIGKLEEQELVSRIKDLTYDRLKRAREEWIISVGEYMSKRINEKFKRAKSQEGISSLALHKKGIESK